MIRKLFGYLLTIVISIAALAVFGLYYVYSPVVDGTLYLQHAMGEAEVLRETETSIPHVYASSEKMAVYTEGFLHAQERLWQMERLRLMTQGRMSEILGERAIGVDKFFRTVGLHRSAIQSIANTDKESLAVLEAYAAGVNDFVAHLGLGKLDSTGIFLPPEFIALGITTFEPWTPVDSICIVKLLNFHLSWNWGQDLLREVLEHSGLEDMVEEIFPFTAEFSHNLVTIIDSEDIKGTKHWSDESLVERYYKSQGKTYQRKLTKAEEEQLLKAQREREAAAAEKAKKEAAEKAKKEAAEKAAAARRAAIEKEEKEEAAKLKAAQDAIKTKTEGEDAEKKRKQKEADEKKKAQTEADKKAAEDKKKKEAEEKAAAAKVAAEKEAAKKAAEEVAKAEKAAVEKAAADATEKAAQKVLDELEIPEKLDESFASNNWVIHGNYTKTGKPLLAGDPHLGNQLPSHWYLMEMTYGTYSTIGATHPGVPLFLFGKTKHMTWAITSALTDLSDLYREKLDDKKSKYFVEGSWRDLKVVKEHISVKGLNQSIPFDIKFTHRGPLVDIDLLQGADVLFSEGIPSSKYTGVYSFAWSGDIPHEDTVKVVREFIKATHINQVSETIDNMEIFSSVPQNLIVAFDNGDIGFFLANNMPIRKHSKPYTGCRVLDGTTTDDDWIGYLPPKDLPRVINPKKGFIVTANNRQMPDNVNIDVGATITSTIRAQRITELIQKGIDANHKFDFRDMQTIQNDTVDLMARDITPIVSKLAHSILNELDSKSEQDAELALNRLAHWYGEMHENSVGATVFATWQFFFYNTLLTEQIEDETVRLALVANYPFIDFVQRMIHTLAEDPENERFNRVCKGAFKEYKGKKHCVYNLARSMAEAYNFLLTEISPEPNDWAWKNVHVNEYAHIPFSLSPLKPLFHREVPVGGNGNTVKVSKYSFKRLKAQKAFKSTHTPNYKQIVQFSDNLEDQKMLYSFDGGQSGNLFAGHYFDFNRRHTDGELMEAVIGRPAVELKKHSTLFIKPAAQKPKEKIMTEKAADRKVSTKEEKEEEF